VTNKAVCTKLTQDGGIWSAVVNVKIIGSIKDVFFNKLSDCYPQQYWIMQSWSPGTSKRTSTKNNYVLFPTGERRSV